MANIKALHLRNTRIKHFELLRPFANAPRQTIESSTWKNFVCCLFPDRLLRFKKTANVFNSSSLMWPSCCQGKARTVFQVSIATATPNMEPHAWIRPHRP